MLILKKEEEMKMTTDYKTKVNQQLVQHYAPSMMRNSITGKHKYLLGEPNNYYGWKTLIFDIIDDLAHGHIFSGVGEKNNIEYWIKQYIYLNKLFNKSYDDILLTSGGAWDEPYKKGLED